MSRTPLFWLNCRSIGAGCKFCWSNYTWTIDWAGIRAILDWPLSTVFICCAWRVPEMRHVRVDANSEINHNDSMELSHKSGAVYYPVSRFEGTGRTCMMRSVTAERRKPRASIIQRASEQVGRWKDMTPQLYEEGAKWSCCHIRCWATRYVDRARSSLSWPLITE